MKNTLLGQTIQLCVCIVHVPTSKHLTGLKIMGKDVRNYLTKNNYEREEINVPNEVSRSQQITTPLGGEQQNAGILSAEISLIASGVLD